MGGYEELPEGDNSFTIAYFEAKERNASRYEDQFERLIIEKVIIVPFQNVLIKYVLAGRQITHSVSRDDGKTYSNDLTKTPLKRKAKLNKARIIEVFAHSEASVELGY